MRELCVIEGDGIGHEVVPAAVAVLKVVMSDLVIHNVPAGWDYFQKTGRSIDPGSVDLARHCGAVLAGAANSPSYPVEGYHSPIVRLRRELGTHANLRPTTYLPVPTARAGIDLLVVRENTEDVYAGVEARVEGGAVVEKRITVSASSRIAHTAYMLALQNGRRRVTIVHKGNVLPETDGLFRKVCLEVAQQYGALEVDDLLVDTAAYWMVKEPTRFDVILTLNQYGDILSDMAAAWGGGLGFAPALNLGENVALAEPVHGTAPDIAGKGIANPTAAILSVAMLLRYHWKLPELAQRIESAVNAVLEARLYTADLVGPRSALSTQAYTEQIIQRLGATA
jgi:homoisocitrate dehydrogenase